MLPLIVTARWDFGFFVGAVWANLINRLEASGPVDQLTGPRKRARELAIRPTSRDALPGFTDNFFRMVARFYN